MPTITDHCIAMALDNRLDMQASPSLCVVSTYIHVCVPTLTYPHCITRGYGLHRYAPWFMMFNGTGPWTSPPCDDNYDPPKCTKYFHTQMDTPRPAGRGKGYVGPPPFAHSDSVVELCATLFHNVQSCYTLLCSHL